MFAMVSAAWSSYVSRAMRFSSVGCGGALASNMCFYADSTACRSASLPAVLARVVSSIGPVVVNGKVVFPLLGAGALAINRTTTSPGWTAAVSTAGNWIVNTAAFGLTANATASGNIPLTVPGSSTPLSRVDPVGVVYNYHIVKLQQPMQAISRNQFPAGFNSDSFPTVAENDCGNPYDMLADVRTQIQPTSTGAVWSARTISINSVSNVASLQSNLCVPSEYAVGAMDFSTVVSSPTDTSTFRSSRVFPRGSAVDLETGLQQSLNSAPNSQYQSFLKAGGMQRAQRNRGKFGASDSKYLSSAYILNGSVADSQSNLIEKQTPSADSIIGGLKRTLGKVQEHISGELLKAVDVAISGQGSKGEAMFERRFLPTIGFRDVAPPSLTYQPPSAEDEFGFGTLFG